MSDNQDAFMYATRIEVHPGEEEMAERHVNKDKENEEITYAPLQIQTIRLQLVLLAVK